MGYSHYWEIATPATDVEFIAVKKMASLIFTIARDEFNINTAGGTGSGEPLIDDAEKLVIFNGVEADDDDYETCRFNLATVTEFDCVKTGNRDYDAVVVAMLMMLDATLEGFSWSSDGEGEDHADGQAIWDALRVSPEMNGEKAAAVQEVAKKLDAALPSSTPDDGSEKKSGRRGILIDPAAQTVTEVYLPNDDIEHIYKAIDATTFDAAHRSDNGDAIFVDDEGLLLDAETLVERGFFRIGQQGNPLAGKGLWLGADLSTGDARDVQISLQEAKALVNFVNAEIIDRRVRLYA